MLITTIAGIFKCCVFLNSTKKENQNKIRKFADGFIKSWSKSMLDACKCQVEVTGLENLESNQAYLYMSNHQSLIDIPVILHALPNSVRMVAKEELMKIPLFGHAMYAGGFIPINRKDKSKAIKQLELAKKRINSGISIWMAPEGTRSKTGELGPFKKGGFHLAKDLNISIVPIWLEGAQHVIPKKELFVNLNQQVQIKIGKPINTENINNLDDLLNLTRTKMLELKN